LFDHGVTVGLQRSRVA